jgi:hypothetical protein
MAIQVLIEHGIPEKQIVFLTFLVVEGKGVSALQHAFPEMLIVSGAVDPELIEYAFQAPDGEAEVQHRQFWIMPGLGNIGPFQPSGRQKQLITYALRRQILHMKCTLKNVVRKPYKFKGYILTFVKLTSRIVPVTRDR